MSIYLRKPFRLVTQQRVDINPFDFSTCRHLKTLVYTVPIKNDETLHSLISYACKSTRNLPGIFEIVPQSMTSPVHACIHSVGGHFEHSF